MKIALVTGSSSGIGKQISLKLTLNNYKVYGISRTGTDNYRNFINCHADVSDEEQIKKVVSDILMKENHIDLVINCAGYGISGAVEFESHDDVLRLLDVNLLGYANVCCAVTPSMKSSHNGKIINISSVAAVMPIPFQTWYSVSKAGINVYTMAYANEVRPFGIEVCSVMLGDTKTGFTGSRIHSEKGNDEYGGRINKSVSKMEKDEQNGYSAKDAADFIYRIVKQKHFHKPIYTMGLPYKLVILLDHLLPAKIKNFFLYLIYAK